jgi:hypothetical protein
MALAGTAGMSTFCNTRQQGDAAGRTEGMSEGASLADTRSKVVLVRDSDVLDGSGKPRAEVISRMLDEGVAELLGEARPEAAWARLVQPEDTVGVKSNEWRFLPTPQVLEDAIRRRIVGAGVSEDRIGIDDRGVLKSPTFREATALEATALINVRPMRTHHWAGVGSCIKNYIMFTPDPPAWHDDACADLAGLWDLPLTKGKTRLNVLVMLTPLFHGKGPHHFQSRYIWDYRGMIIGTDPVAVDATGLRILEAKRREHFKSDQPFVVSPKHIRVAQDRHHLGVADPSRIDVIRMGWKDGALI